MTRSKHSDGHRSAGRLREPAGLSEEWWSDSLGNCRGEVSERLKEPASKAGRLAKTGLVGSNPTLSAT
jgi:hypothetical protein